MNTAKKQSSKLKTSILIAALTFLVSTAGLTATQPESATQLEPTVSVEYLGHACFVIESSTGTRVVIDPFNSHSWIGYEFPDPPPADAILVTHPHYDHDASYYWPNDIPVFRRPGSYAVSDVRFEGVAGRHCDPYGKEFGQTNTIWVLEVDGLRIVHLGDNGPISPELAESLGRVDVLMLPVDATFHILKREEVDQALALLNPRVIVPMHYQIPELAEQVQDLGPIDPWLEGRDAVIRVPGHTTRLDPSALPAAGSVLVLKPSPSTRTWSEAFLAARQEISAARAAAARDAAPEEVIGHLRRAVELRPTSVGNARFLAGRLAAAGKKDEAIRVLERSLANAGRDDWTRTAHARLTLAQLYLEAKETVLAKEQARLILASSQNLELRRQASEILGPLSPSHD